MFYRSPSLSPADFYLKLPPSGDSRWSYLLLRRHPFFQGAQSSVAKSKAAPWQSVRGYDKKPCNKGLLCNLMCPETGHSAHFNELRSPFSNHSGWGNDTLAHSPWKNSLCDLYVGRSMMNTGTLLQGKIVLWRYFGYPGFRGENPVHYRHSLEHFQGLNGHKTLPDESSQQ